MEVLTIIAYTLISVGVAFCVVAVVGMLRFPDVYTRYHAGTKGVTAGNLLILAGVAIVEWSLLIALKLFIIAIFFLMTNPVGTHAIARAAYRSKSALACVFFDAYDPYVREELASQAEEDAWVSDEVSSEGERAPQETD